MKRKLGPLPVWSWLLIATGTFLAVWYWRKQQNASTTTSQSTLSGDLAPLPTSPYYTPTNTGGGGGSGYTGTLSPYLQNIESTLAGIQNELGNLPTTPIVESPYTPTTPPPKTQGSSKTAYDKWWEEKEAKKDAAAARWNKKWVAKHTKTTRRTTTHKYGTGGSHSSGTKRSGGTGTVHVSGQKQSDRTQQKKRR